jgi:murein DD-endopeptidase MepM/ murein hydrolase activator NlpD
MKRMKRQLFVMLLLGSLLFLGNRGMAQGATYHIVKEGENLWTISRQYKIPLRKLFELNNLSEDSVLQPGMKILIEGEKVPQGNNLLYEVKQGDNPWRIAQKFQVPLLLLLEVNGLTEESVLRVGQKIIIPLSGRGGASSTAQEVDVSGKSSGRDRLLQDGGFLYEVRRGDNPWRIAQRFKIPLSVLFEVNDLNEKSVLRVGQKLTIPLAGIPLSRESLASEVVQDVSETRRSFERDSAPQGSILYEVRQGDTLWKVAREFKVPLRLLFEANGLAEKSILQVGQKIVIPLSGRGAVATSTRGARNDEAQSQAFHVVRQGDSLWRVARQYGVDVRSLMRTNNLNEKSILQVGMRLVIPGRTGTAPSRVSAAVYDTYTVQKGDTLWSISRRLGISLKELLQANGLKENATLRIGQKLRVPSRGGVASSSRNQSGFIWPLGGRISSYFGRRGRGFHCGIDIVAPSGTIIRAARDGVVSFSGWMNGYGRVVIVTHSSGLQTVYAHNSVNLVREGQRVRQGDPIARVGSTGNATCPHLHFEIRQGGRPVDPLQFLRR